MEAYLDRCRDLVLRVEGSLPALAANGASAWTVTEIERFLSHAVRQIDQVDRRLLKGETIPSCPTARGSAPAVCAARKETAADDGIRGWRGWRV